MKEKKKKLSKKIIEEQVLEVFSKKQNPTQKQIKKTKKLAMSKNIKLGNLKKKFCSKCFSFFTSNNSEIRIKKGFKILKCKECDYISKYKLK
jgi:RNase P subunit RPR2